MKYSFFWIFLLGILMGSCEKTKGKEDPKIHHISLPAYNGVSLFLDCTLEIEICPFSASDTSAGNDTFVYDAKVVAQANIHRLIEYKVEGGILTIRLKENNIIRKYEPIRISVQVPDISYLSTYGVSRTVIRQQDTLQRAYLVCKVHNSSSVNIRSVNYSYLQVSLFEQGYLFADSTGMVAKEHLLNQGSGNINLLPVKADSVFASVQQAGEISASPGVFLDAVISGSGNIYYRGDTVKVQSNITGKGLIIKL